MTVYVLLISTYIDEPFFVEGVFETAELAEEHAKKIKLKNNYPEWTYKYQKFPLVMGDEE